MQEFKYVPNWSVADHDEFVDYLKHNVEEYDKLTSGWNRVRSEIYHKTLEAYLSLSREDQHLVLSHQWKLYQDEWFDCCDDEIKPDVRSNLRGSRVFFEANK